MFECSQPVELDFYGPLLLSCYMPVPSGADS